VKPSCRAEFIGEGGSQRVIAIVSGGTEPRDNYAAQETAERDWGRALGDSDARSGQISKKKVTATEVRNSSGNAAARDETEKDSARDFFVLTVGKFDCLLQRYADPRDVEKVLGAQGAQFWEQWRQRSPASTATRFSRMRGNTSMRGTTRNEWSISTT
jgi:hypothetical protein